MTHLRQITLGAQSNKDIRDAFIWDIVKERNKTFLYLGIKATSMILATTDLILKSNQKLQYSQVFFLSCPDLTCSN